MSELSNCPSCGKLFVKTGVDICPSCIREIDKKFEIVHRYIRSKATRESTITEVEEATGVEEKLIFQWIREGRLKVKDLVNFTYPCKSCGKLIQGGTLCQSCSDQLKQDFEAVLTEDEKEQRKKTYYTR